MKSLIYAPDARADLRAIARYIGQSNPARARTFVDELRVRAGQAAAQPRSFARRDDLDVGLRAARHGRYVILFRELDDVVRIVRIVHGAQNLPAMFKD